MEMKRDLEGERKRMLSTWFTPEAATLFRVGIRPKPAAQAKSFSCVSERARSVGSVFSVFSSVIAESWSGNGAAGTNQRMLEAAAQSLCLNTSTRIMLFNKADITTIVYACSVMIHLNRRMTDS